MLKIFNIKDVNGVFLMSLLSNCKNMSNFVLIAEFEQANVCFVHIEKENIFEEKIGYIMCYVLFQVGTKFINK